MINIITISTNTETSLSHPLPQDYIDNQLIRKLANEMVDSKVVPIHRETKEVYNKIYDGTILEHDIHINIISDEDVKKIRAMEELLDDMNMLEGLYKSILENK